MKSKTEIVIKPGSKWRHATTRQVITVIEADGNPLVRGGRGPKRAIPRSLFGKASEFLPVALKRNSDAEKAQ